MVRQIHLAEILFTNHTDYKVRPILIIKENSFGDILFMPMTTNLIINGIMINVDDLEIGYLPKPSKVVFEKIGVIHKSLITKHIATITGNKNNEIIQSFINFITK
ncbi:MAG: hypothetical protein HW421_3175 [Ignavibacteria bacterium]|nr:hypothetical protein [Ignavibacteria bacterium]